MKLTPIEYIGAPPVRKKRRSPLGGWFLLAFALLIGGVFLRPFFLKAQSAQTSDQNVTNAIESLEQGGSFGEKLAAQALKRTVAEIDHDSAYYKIDFPMGDIPADRGKDVDVIVRSYRAMGTDLQQILHEDISNNFRSYPQLFGAKAPDTNIDHRRVPNLQRFFIRKGTPLGATTEASDYSFGDIVVWRLVDGNPHIGLVVPGPGTRENEKWVVHNIGSGPAWEDCLFDYNVIGHYRYTR